MGDVSATIARTWVAATSPAVVATIKIVTVLTNTIVAVCSEVSTLDLPWYVLASYLVKGRSRS